MAIRVWMRTAVKKDITSFGTFLSTLCHEYCHHLDFEHFKFPDSWHTRGFYERAAALYHYARGTPPKRLHWAWTGLWFVVNGDDYSIMKGPKESMRWAKLRSRNSKQSAWL